MCEYLARSGVNNVAFSSRVSKALLLLSEAYKRVVETKVFKSPLHSANNKVAHASIECCTKSTQTAFFLCLALCIDSVSYSYASCILDCPCTSNFIPVLFKAWFSDKAGSCFHKLRETSLIRPRKVTQLSGVHDPVKEYLIRVLFSKPHVVCNLGKVFTCRQNFLHNELRVEWHMYMTWMMTSSCLLFVSANGVVIRLL